MNILFLTTHLNIGGITSYIVTLGKGLVEKGHRVYIASSGGDLVAALPSMGIGHVSIPIKTKQEFSFKVARSFFALRGVIKEKNISLVHSHTRVTQILGCLIQRYCHVPCLSTCHGFFTPKFSRKVFPCWGRKVIAISESVKEHLINDFGVREDRVRLIHNGIDVFRFNAFKDEDKIRIKKTLGLKEEPVVGIVARLSDVKGHKYLIEAMKGVLAVYPGVQLLIAGDGRMKEELVRLVKSEGIQENTYFLPTVADTVEVLTAIDIFVMPSLKEGLGLSLMEAMACGLPVIGSEVGGIKSLIQQGVNGVLVQPAQSAGLSRAILDLLKDTGKAASLGARARDFIAHNFSQERMVKETEEVYLECVR